MGKISCRSPAHPARATDDATRGASEDHDHRRRQHGSGNRDTRARGGHEVEIVARDPAEARTLAEDVGGSATALEPDAQFGGEIVVYYPGIKDAVEHYGDRLRGKIVVDITKVDTQTWDRLATEPGSSSAEEVARILPEGHACGQGIQHHLRRQLVDGSVSGQQLDVLIAGDDESAKQKVTQLASDGGLRPLDVGPLARAQQLEQLGSFTSH